MHVFVFDMIYPTRYVLVVGEAIMVPMGVEGVRKVVFLEEMRLFRGMVGND